MSKAKQSKVEPGTLPEGNGLLTADELANYWRVHLVTLYRWMGEGRVPAIPVGSDYRISREVALRGVPSAT